MRLYRSTANFTKVEKIAIQWIALSGLRTTDPSKVNSCVRKIYISRPNRASCEKCNSKTSGWELNSVGLEIHEKINVIKSHQNIRLI